MGGATPAHDPIRTGAPFENRMPAVTLSVLTFLSPAWALGLAAAVGLPVLAHLLSRSRYLPVDFPGTRFVAQAVIETRRINRPRHWLLLMLRVLALAAVVGAFMQPRWDRAAAAPGHQRGECVVLILDVSASMQRNERGEPLIDQARMLAHAQLDALDPQHDRAVIILAGLAPRPLLGEPSGNFTLLRDRLDAARWTYEAADMAGAVALADAVLADQDRPGRVVILSDGQATNRPATPLQTPLSGAALTELRVGDEPAGNLAVHLLDAAPYPPVAGVPLDLTVELNNFGPTPAEVTLHAEGGGAPASQRISLNAGAAITQVVTLIPDGAAADGGVATFRVWLDVDDGFDADNATGLVAAVAPARRVLLFTDSPATEDSAAARVGLALSRAESGGDEPTSSRATAVVPLLVAQHRPAAFTDHVPHADDASACWVVVGLSEAAAGDFLDAVDKHLRGGGGVVWILDSAASREALSSVADAPLRVDAGGGAVATIASARFEHPALAAFEGPSRASLVGVRMAGVSKASAGEDAAVLLRSAAGRPVLVSRGVGRGRLVVFNADLSPSRSDFASQPGFVPLMNELVRYAAPGPASPRPPRPGEPIPGRLSAAGHQLLGPTAGEDAPQSDRFTSPGAYRAIDTDATATAGVWAELDPAESDFTPAPSRGTADGASGVAGPVLLEAGHARPRIVELWPYLIVCGLLLVGAESLLLVAFGRKGGGA